MAITYISDVVRVIRLTFVRVTTSFIMYAEQVFDAFYMLEQEPTVRL